MYAHLPSCLHDRVSSVSRRPKAVQLQGGGQGFWKEEEVPTFRSALLNPAFCHCLPLQSPWSHSYLPGHAGPWVLGQPDCCVHLNGDRGTSPSSSCWSACSGGLIGSGALGIVCAYCVHREPCPPQLHTPRASGNEESTQRGMLIAFLPCPTREIATSQHLW